MQGVQLQQEERLFKQNLKAMDAARWLIPCFFATCFLFSFRTLADERKKLYEESMAEKRRRAVEEEAESTAERERLVEKAKEVEEEKRRHKEVKAEKQARLARYQLHTLSTIKVWRQRSVAYDLSKKLISIRFWHHQKTEVEDNRQKEVKIVIKDSFCI